MLLIVWCEGVQPLLGISSAAVKFLFADRTVASDARIKNYSSRELWVDGGPLVRASATPLPYPLQLGIFSRVNRSSRKASLVL